MPDYVFAHIHNERRKFTATLPHIELMEALDAGYRVTRLIYANV
jgi:hypothetical protein